MKSCVEYDVLTRSIDTLSEHVSLGRVAGDVAAL